MLGIPAGIQNAIFAMANLFIQTGVNSFSAVMVSGNAAAANADAGDLPPVWRKIRGDRTVHGSDRDDSHLLTGA